MEPSVVAPPSSKPTPVRYEAVYVWRLPVRIFHWVNALATIVLFSTGLWIAFPPFASVGEAADNFLMGRVRQIHFISAYVFLFVYLMRFYCFFFGNVYARSGVPYVWRRSWWKDVGNHVMEYVRLDVGRPHLGHNSLAGLVYTLFVIGLGFGQIVTGFAMFGEVNPGGFWDSLFGWVIPLLGGSFRVHMWHHLFAWGFIVFAIVHIYIVLLDTKHYGNGLVASIITGFKFRRISDTERRKGE